MGYLGVSIILASVVYVVFRPPQPLLAFFAFLRQPRGSLQNSRPKPALKPPEVRLESEEDSPSDGPSIQIRLEEEEAGASIALQPAGREDASSRGESALRAEVDRAAMPPPPPSIRPPSTHKGKDKAPTEPEEQTTPKAAPTRPPTTVPAFSFSDLSATGLPRPTAIPMPPPPLPTLRSGPSLSAPSSSTSSSSLAPPRLAAFPAANSPQRASPIPNRGPSAGSGGLGANSLAPPPTHTTKPAKPSRKVVLTPGHSPLDWARISGPNADLRGLPPQTPYLRVPPSALRRQTGRKGKDAWTALNGRVYNITPYLPYHPGGEPELLRAAGRDGTRLFAEIHSWVNYETMLASCLVGILVDEEEAKIPSEMESMD